LAELLKVNVSLHTLILHSTQAENRIFFLKKNNNTKTENGIKSRGAQCLADALFHNSTLKTLSLSGNLIDHEGATFLSSALQTNSTLQPLDLSGNEVGEAGVRFLAGLLKFNNNLMSLNLCSTTTNRLAKNLTKQFSRKSHRERRRKPPRRGTQGEQGTAHPRHCREPH